MYRRKECSWQKVPTAKAYFAASQRTLGTAPHGHLSECRQTGSSQIGMKFSAGWGHNTNIHAMENTLILTTEPFVGFMPADLRNWLQRNSKDEDLAVAMTEVHNHVGCLGHELDESDDRWLTYVFEEWWALEKEICEMITGSMRQANLSGEANYDLEQSELYYLVKPFMEKNGYRDGHGWWIAEND